MTDAAGAVADAGAEAYPRIVAALIRVTGDWTLAEDCARDHVYEFMFVAPPIPITGAVGSPVNPFAIK